MTETETDLVQRLCEAVSEDHTRGCQGRQYSCSCGRDISLDVLLRAAATEIERLRGAAQGVQVTRLAERLADVVMMLDAPDAYNREYIAAVCRSILSSLHSSTDEKSPVLNWKLDRPECPRCRGHGRVGIMACNDCGATGVVVSSTGGK